jgi:hypothetical protein
LTPKADFLDHATTAVSVACPVVVMVELRWVHDIHALALALIGLAYLGLMDLLEQDGTPP